MLTQEQKTRLGNVLTTKRAQLLKSAHDGLRLSLEHERTIGRDSIDESMEEEIYSTHLRLRDREKFLLNKIDSALHRLSQGTIEVCEMCEEPISFARLLARPEANLCIECKEETEMEEQVRTQFLGHGAMEGDQMPEDHPEE